MVLAQGKLNGLVCLGEVLFLQNNQKYTEPLFKLRASPVFASGFLFVGVDQAQSLHNPETQLPNENAGFPMPQQLVDLTLAEVEDLVLVVAPVLIPIFGEVKWYNAPLDLDGKSFRFPWQTEILRKRSTASLRANSRPNYSFKLIQIPNRYWASQEVRPAAGTIRPCSEAKMPKNR